MGSAWALLCSNRFGGFFKKKTFLLFTFLTSCHLLCCSFTLNRHNYTGQNVWLCWTFLPIRAGFLLTKITTTGQKPAGNCDGPIACCRRGMGETSRNASSQALFSVLQPLCSPWSGPSLENSLLFIPPCTCAKSLSNYTGSVPQLQAQKLWWAEQEWAAVDRSLEVSQEKQEFDNYSGIWHFKILC